MKKHFAFVAAALALLTSGVAQASTVNYTGDNVNMNTVAVGQSGTITDNMTGGSNINVAQGTIAPDSYILFSYNLTGATGTPSLTSQGSYDYKSQKKTFSGTAYATSSGISVQAALAQAFANITVSLTGTTGTAEIINNSASMVSFLVELTGFFPKGFSYNYAAVPLPASLQLFLAGLAVLAIGMSRKKAA